MKDITEIRQLIAPTIEQAEKKRLKILTDLKKKQFLYLLPIPLFLFILLTGLVSGQYFIILFGLIISVILFLFIHKKVLPQTIVHYQKEIKSVLVEAVARTVYPSISFDAAHHVSPRNFSASTLYDDYNQYRGEDHCEGITLNHTAFEFSELQIENVHDNFANYKESSTEEIFKGLFVVLTLPQMICDYPIKILPDIANKERATDKLLQKNFSPKIQSGNLVYFEENPAFEEMYAVYAQDETQARKILTPTMLGVLYNLKYTLDQTARICMIGKKVYIGIAKTEDYFEIDIKKSLIAEENSLTKLCKELALVFALVEDFSTFHNTTQQAPATYTNPSTNPFL